jgi:NodT family efflux transporter outer membrane factor (OMF) lipoprotein
MNPRCHRHDRRRLKALLPALAAACALSACALGPDYVKPAVAVPSAYKESLHWHPATAPSDDARAGADWWHRFGDDGLDQLEAKAMASNQTLAAAVADYGRAVAIVAQLDAALSPTADAGVGASRSRDTSAIERENRYSYYPITSLHAIVRASWEPDIWGQARSRIEAATASKESAAAIVSGVRLSLSAALAGVYFDLRALDLDLHDLHQKAEHAARLAEMARAAADEGLADEDTVANARNAVDLLYAQAERERALRARDEHGIAALIGAAPADVTIMPLAGYRLPTPDVLAGLPSRLLERRPDIVRAERDVAAANAAIGVARAAFFPDLILGADIGGQNTELAGLLSAPARVWSLGSSLAVSLFDAGRRSAQLEQTHKEFDAAAARYRATVIAALQEVEDSLATQRRTDQARGHAQQVLERSQEILQRQENAERLGLSSLMQVTRAYIDMLEAKRQWQGHLAASTQERVMLIKSLGGYWDPQFP